MLQQTVNLRFKCMRCWVVLPIGHAHRDIIGQTWDLCEECASGARSDSVPAADRPEAGAAEG